ncbi:protein of unknown function (plasmid) [Rhodovastum atsumiense]|nr:hypothetical protein [Rhodovastum atsumiense]CAH2606175.1 protein of unknown function [Rhodovastum atsumiense]
MSTLRADPAVARAALCAGAGAVPRCLHRSVSHDVLRLDAYAFGEAV